MMELGPKLRRTPVMDASKPVRIALTPMMVPVPMITPSTVRNARSLCERMVCSASVMPLTNASHVMLFLDSQGFDGVETGGLPRRVDAEEQADHGRQSDSDTDRSPGQRHGNGSGAAYRDRQHPGQDDADQAAGRGEHGGFHQILIEDVAPPGAERFADADFVRTLGHH